jgi:hypothetical protein
MGKEKVVVGIPFYCHAFKLLNPLMHGYHAYSNGAGECDSSVYACVSIIAIFINDFYTPVSRRTVLCDWVWRVSTQVSAQ